MKVDLNLDAGEDLAALKDGREERLYRLVTRVNIACGGHAGDAASMELAVELAARHGLAIGAHPSYPDKANFGRVALDIPPAGVTVFTAGQMDALKQICDRRGVRLGHVKAHGMLYNQLAGSPALAAAFADGVAKVDKHCVLIGLAGSRALELWRAMGFQVMGEAFADRRYRADGTLVPRAEPGAVIAEPAAAAEQAESLLLRAEARAANGKTVHIRCQTLCVHGDNPAAEALLKAIRARLT
jgi:UPF0271 protein